MNKGSTLKILIVIIMVAIVAFFAFGQSAFAEGNVKVGDVSFAVPQGYHEGELNSLGEVNLTDGNEEIFIAECDGDDVKSVIDEYKSNTTASISSSDLTVDDISVYKTVNDKSGSEHYWFAKDGKVYTVYVWKGHGDVENTIFDIIKSTSA